MFNSFGPYGLNTLFNFINKFYILCQHLLLLDINVLEVYRQNQESQDQKFNYSQLTNEKQNFSFHEK